MAGPSPSHSGAPATVPRVLGRGRSARSERWSVPWECPVCGGEGDRTSAPFCADCRAELLGAAGRVPARGAPCRSGRGRITAEGCGECRGRPLGFDAAIALGPYQGPIRDLCLRLKHERNAWIAPWLAGVLARGAAGRCASRRRIARGRGSCRSRCTGGGGWARGYNQAEALARGLARPARAAAGRRPLRRVKPTAILARAGPGRAGGSRCAGRSRSGATCRP